MQTYHTATQTSLRLRSHWFILILLSTTSLQAQLPTFNLSPNSPIVLQNGDTLTNAWAGGLHSPQISSIDLDNNGTSDLFIFDRINNAVLPFLNTENGYRYASQYARMFPRDLHDWAFLQDIDSDSLPDLLTYGIAGIRYFHAHRNSDNSLTYTPPLNQLSFWGLSGTPLNIPATPVDLPALSDIDHDGDIDILQFDFIGKYVEYYENQSQQLTQTPADSLWFLLADPCWGKFSEQTNNNTIVLNDDCGGEADPNLPPTNPPDERHTGSSILLYDEGGDNDIDLLIGDVSHRNLLQLTNNNGLMNNPIYHFPDYDTPVDIHLFPASYSVDIDNDSVWDLLVAPNEKRSQTHDQIWAYHNIGTATAPLFSLQTRNFLSEQMIDVGLRSQAVFADYNHDTLPDLWISNLGELDTSTNTPQYIGAKIALYLNTGTLIHPTFELLTDNYHQFDTLQLSGIFPTFGDLDNDGDADLLTGDEFGNIHFFRNHATANEPMNLLIDTPNLLHITGGTSITPCLFDIDQDNKLDLIVGEKLGKLRYYHNETINATPNFVLQNDFWGMVDVRNLGYPFGYSAPHISIFGNDTILLVNSESGKVFAYKHLQQNSFDLISDSLFNAYHARRGNICTTSPIEGLYFLVMGNNRGGISWYIADTNGIGIEPNPPIPLLRSYPNPTSNIVQIEGLENGKNYQIIATNSLGQSQRYRLQGETTTSIVLPSMTAHWWLFITDINGNVVGKTMVIQIKP